MQIIDGKKIAEDIKTEIAKQVEKIIDAGERAPHLAAILVGEDEASQTYVKNKEKNCKEAGFTSSVYRFPDSITEPQLFEIIDYLNNDEEVDGFIVQLPLPGNINADKILQHIDPKKDIDGFHPLNVGRMMLNLPAFLPATPYGIIELIKRYKIETKGKHIVIVGRSNIVGTPLSVMLSRKAEHGNATVTLCHSYTQNLKELCLSADILIAAIGQPHFIKAEMVKQGAVVIDVGIHRIPSDHTKSGFKIIGDVDFENVSKKTSFITPVPGGVGPMTISALLLNTIKAYKNEV